MQELERARGGGGQSWQLEARSSSEERAAGGGKWRAPREPTWRLGAGDVQQAHAVHRRHHNGAQAGVESELRVQRLTMLGRAFYVYGD
jgi:hypothetical protein